MCLLRRPSKFGRFAATLFLVFCAQPALTNVTSFGVDAKIGLITLLFQYTAYGAILIAIGANWKLLLRQFVSRRMLWIVLLTSLAFASTVWSEVPAVTARRSVQLVFTELIAVYFAVSLTPRQQLRLVSFTLLFLLSFSLIAVFMFPSYGTMPKTMGVALTGNWRGIFPHKNTLGRYASLAAIIFAINWLQERSMGWIVAVLFALVMLDGSRSMTSTIVCGAVLLSLPLFRLLRGKAFYSALTFIGGVFAVSIWYVLDNFYTVMDMLGRSPTLTGRVQLWAAGIFVGLRRNPWLGYGWDGFWRGYDGASASVWRFVHWNAPNIHNGFLELWLSLGLVGLICFGLCHLITTNRAFRLQRVDRSVEALWPLAFLLYFTLQNMTESTGVSQNSLVWVLYVMVVYQVYEAVGRSHILAFGKPVPRVAAVCERAAEMRPVDAKTVLR